jgi:hypothetical protein
LIGEQFGRAEDVVYIVLGFLLACTAGALLVTSSIELMRAIVQGNPMDAMVSLLDRLLLTLMVVALVVSLRPLQTRKKDAQ